ncbi:putative retrotransposon hot spot protein 4 (RHS4) [Trypanosoma vivax]|nr:putative retrotransposon hot spot protein 4 (RHS4) [Trypanosoma vivax]
MESVRVQNTAKTELEKSLARSEMWPTALVLVVSPDIGKLFSVRLHLMYESLRCGPGELGVVMFLICETMFIFYMLSISVPEMVEEYEKTSGVELIVGLSEAGRRGCMVLDVKRDVGLSTNFSG